MIRRAARQDAAAFEKRWYGTACGLRRVVRSAAMAVAGLGLLSGMAHAVECRRVVMDGEVSAGKDWSADVGQGWVFRVLPIGPAQSGFSGWDLVVDRQQGTGFPDALLLATPPYGSLNEREIGTTFGLRAQDAIGWNPRSFRFLADGAVFSEGQRVFRGLQQDGMLLPAGRRGTNAGAGGNKDDRAAMRRLLELQTHAAAGELRILDARIVPGTADAASYAREWALAASRTPHEDESSGQASPRGALLWMRFEVTLWLPAKWVVPPGRHSDGAVCPP